MGNHRSSYYKWLQKGKCSCIGLPGLRILDFPVSTKRQWPRFFASEAAVHAASDTMRTFSSYGFSTEYLAERFLRDAQSLRVIEGTSNIQKTIIADISMGDTANW